MAQDHDQFRARDLAGELQASKDVVIEHIAGDARIEEVTNALVEQQFNRRAGVQAAQDHGERILAAGCGTNLRR